VPDVSGVTDGVAHPEEALSATYQGGYADSRGKFPAVFANDGETFSMTVLDVTFRGQSLDDLDPDPETPPALLDGFTTSFGLCACDISLAMPLPVLVEGIETIANLNIDLHLGPPRPPPHAGVSNELLKLELAVLDIRLQSSGKSAWFEDELLDLAQQLPAGTSIKSCFFCQYSDYSPYGSGLIGSMLCFRNIKAEYSRVKDKEAFWTVHDRFDRQVQETYLCGDFRPRIAGTGYRG